MGDPVRDENCVAIVFIQIDGYMLQVTRGARPKIEQNIAQPPPQASYQLRFARRRPLKMHTAHRSRALVIGNARLQRSRWQVVSGKFSSAVGARKESSRVRLRLD